MERHKETTGFTHISREDFARERDIIFAEHMIAIRLTRRKYSHGTSLGGNEVLCKVERDIKILTGARDYTVSCGNPRDFHNAVKIPRKALDTISPPTYTELIVQEVG